MPKKKTIKQFIEEANKIHNDFYDYSSVIYKNNRTKIKIICPIHGVFKQNPTAHLNGHSCSMCSKNSKRTTFSFIEEANKFHDNFYDYSSVEYINAHVKVKILCPIHGVFEQSPNNHLRHGCEQCSVLVNTKKLTKRIDVFITQANKIHNNFYDYSSVNYINARINIIIRCYEHGIFKQTPDSHLRGTGCPKCANKKRRLKRIKEIEIDKFNGNQIIPSYNPNACELFDKISEEKNIHIQHAMNGGEYNIKELGYWVDGYDEENNIVYEFDEKYHKYQKEKDIIRQNEIIKHLKCEFIRIKEKTKKPFKNIKRKRKNK